MTWRKLKKYQTYIKKLIKPKSIQNNHNKIKNLLNEIFLKIIFYIKKIKNLKVIK